MKPFKSVMTQEQMDEIISIGMDGHTDALVAYGGDLYRQGVIKGAIVAMAGWIVGEIITMSIDVLKERKLKKEPET